MEPQSSLPYSQAPTTCPYPEPNPSSPHNLLGDLVTVTGGGWWEKRLTKKQ